MSYVIGIENDKCWHEILNDIVNMPIKEFDELLAKLDNTPDVFAIAPHYIEDECPLYSPEVDNPYPLCVGNSLCNCKDCCVYADYEKYHSPYKE